VNENAINIEMKNMGLFTSQQRSIKVYYENQEVDDYFADIIVNDQINTDLSSCICVYLRSSAANKKEIYLLLSLLQNPNEDVKKSAAIDPENLSQRETFIEWHVDVLINIIKDLNINISCHKIPIHNVSYPRIKDDLAKITGKMKIVNIPSMLKEHIIN
jgi:hypothetical protein